MTKKKTQKGSVKPKPEGYVFGAPTKYKPEYCQMLIDHMSSGLSFESFAAVVNTWNGTLYNWCETHQDFLHAKLIGQDKSRQWWENQGKNGLFSMGGVSLNPTVYRMNMINRFKWKDKAEDDKKISFDLDKLTDAELDKKIKELEDGKASEGSGRDRD